MHYGSSGSVKSLEDLEHFDLGADLLWSDSVATIGNNGHTPKWGALIGCRPGKLSQRKFPSLFAIAVFVHFASQYYILRKMSGRYGKAKRQFSTKPMSRCRQLSLARSVIRKREKGGSEADTNADAPVAGHSAGPVAVQLEAEPEQMPSSTELDVRISYHCLHQDVMYNIFWQLISCQLGIPEG